MIDIDIDIDIDIEDEEDFNDPAKLEKIICLGVKIICWSSIIFAVIFMIIIRFSKLIGLTLD